LEVSGAVRQL